MHSWWVPGTHYRRATNRGCITTLLLQSSVRSNRQRTQRLPSWSAWKQHVLTMLFVLIIWPPKGRLRSLRSEALTQTSRWTTIAGMTNFISGCQGAAGIMKMKVMKATCAMPSPPPAGDDGPQLNSRGLTWEPRCRRVWGRGWRRCVCGWGGRSLTSRWWINAECGGRRA